MGRYNWGGVAESGRGMSGGTVPSGRGVAARLGGQARPSTVAHDHTNDRTVEVLSGS